METIYFVGGFILGFVICLVSIGIGAKFMYRSIYREDIPLLGIKKQSFRPVTKTNKQVTAAEGLTSQNEKLDQYPVVMKEKMKELINQHK